MPPRQTKPVSHSEVVAHGPPSGTGVVVGVAVGVGVAVEVGVGVEVGVLVGVGSSTVVVVHAIETPHRHVPFSGLESQSASLEHSSPRFSPSVQTPGTAHWSHSTHVPPSQSWSPSHPSALLFPSTHIPSSQLPSGQSSAPEQALPSFAPASHTPSETPPPKTTLRKTPASVGIKTIWVSSVPLDAKGPSSQSIREVPSNSVSTHVVGSVSAVNAELWLAVCGRSPRKASGVVAFSAAARCAKSPLIPSGSWPPARAQRSSRILVYPHPLILRLSPPLALR